MALSRIAFLGGLLVGTMLVGNVPALCDSIGSSFTFQGKLTDSSGQPVSDGSLEVNFRLFDDASPGSPDKQIGPTLTKTVTTASGVFTTDLDFGVPAFDTGEARWVEVEAQGSVLLPRIRISPAPYAVFSAAPWETVTDGIRYSGGDIAVGGGQRDVELAVAGKISMTGVRLGTAASAGDVLTANALGEGSWQPIPATPPNGPAGGDLTGSYPDPTIGSGAVTNTKLATDGASLAKVSGGTMGVLGSSVGAGCTTPAYMFQVHGSNMTVDQVQPNCNMGRSTIGAGGFWQSFTAGVTSNLVAVQANFTVGGGSSFTLYSGEGTGGAVLRMQDIPASYSGEHFVVLNNPAPIVAGGKYTFLVSSSDQSSICYWNGDAYPGGTCNIGGDMLFRTYVSVSPATPLLVADYMTQTVGIGVGTPTAKLDVNGPVKMTGFRLGTSATAGQVLTSDASGNGTWQSITGSFPPTGSAGGDLGGTYPNPVIANGVVTQAKIASNLDVDKLDGKHASDFVSASMAGAIAATPVTTVSTLVTFSGANVGYLTTSGSHDEKLKIYCTGGVLEWRLCYGSTVSGAAISSGSMNIITYPHDTPFQIKVYRGSTHAVVDLWENDGVISGLYRKNQ